MLISARNLTRRYGAHTAVAGLDLTLRQGEILGLLGPNGAGKTTTLRMLAGCLAPTSGDIRIKGEDMARAPVRAKAALGYLPEIPPLYPELTVDEHLAFCARLRRIPARQRAKAVNAAKADCGLDDVGRRIVGNLSKGYRQRVGLAQAILHRPDVVILDEPTVGLDPNQIREIRALIRRLGERHSVILSSHILPEIQATCARVAILHEGRLVFDRDMADIAGRDRPDEIIVGLRHPPPDEELATVPGVRDAVPAGDGLWRLACRPGADPRGAIAERAATAGWGLFELRAAGKTLEEIFIDLTGGTA